MKSHDDHQGKSIFFFPARIYARRFGVGGGQDSWRIRPTFLPLPSGSSEASKLHDSNATYPWNIPQDPHLLGGYPHNPGVWIPGIFLQQFHKTQKKKNKNYDKLKRAPVSRDDCEASASPNIKKSQAQQAEKAC